MCNVMRGVLFVVAVTFLLGSASDGWAASIDAYAEYMLGTTYVDAYANSAEDFNIWATDSVTYPNLEDWSKAGNGTTLLWGRTTASSNPIDNTDLEGRDSDTLPQLTMTVTGLDVTKSYNVYAVYWAKNPEVVTTGYWYTLAKLEGESELLEASYATATNIFYNNTVNTAGTNGCEKLLGVVSGVSEFSVIVAGPPSDATLDQRARFDGISYSVIPEPSTAVLLALLLLSLSLRRKCR